jgi:hypothetical protein
VTKKRKKKRRMALKKRRRTTKRTRTRADPSIDRPWWSSV